MMLLKKEWKLVMMPVPLLFLLLSALVLVPNYPYYVTFFYTTLGIFLMMQFARENRDLYYMALLPVTKREMVRARFLLVLSVEALQVLVCVPFMLLRASYGSVKNAVGIEANAAFWCCWVFLTASSSRCTTKTPTIWESRSCFRASHWLWVFSSWRRFSTSFPT